VSRASVKAYQHLASILEQAGQSAPVPEPGGHGAKTPPEMFPASWATSWGEDEFGFWCGVDLKGIEQRFRWIPPGQARIGSPENEPRRFDNEHRYCREVDGFWFAETACTQELWLAITGESPSRFAGNNHPVEKVSWDDIHQKFLPAFDELAADLCVRLPAEVEWEYACRAGSEEAFWWGDKLTTELANYDGRYPYAKGKKGEYRKETVEVLSFCPNPWGLYQMHGNVWEWCSDVWQANPTEGSVSSGTGQFRVIRGGSWDGLGRDLRSAMRNGHRAGSRNSFIGFRLVAGPGKHR